MSQISSAISLDGGLPVMEEDTSQDFSADSSGGGDPSTYGAIVTKAGPGKTPKAAVRDLYMKPMPRSHVAFNPPPGWTRWFYWDTLTKGDCRMEQAKVWIYPDAMVLFNAYTYSSDDDDIDVWIIRGIQFYSGYGVTVGQPIPKHVGFQMAWQGSEYPFTFWSAIPGVAPTGVDQIRSARMTYHC